MRGVTHVVIGVAGILLYETVLCGKQLGGDLSVTTAAASVLVAVAGSLIPDIDHPGAMATRGLTLLFKGSRLGVWLTSVILIITGILLWPPLISFGLFMATVSMIPHRGVTHSIVGLGVSSFLVWLFGGILVIPFLIGYALHLVADMLTGGVPLLWPYGERVTVAAAKTGGLVDWLSLLVSFGFVMYTVVFKIFY